MSFKLRTGGAACGVWLLMVLAIACSSDPDPIGPADAGVVDASAPDTSVVDADANVEPDSANADASADSSPTDADSGSNDANADSGSTDASADSDSGGHDASVDSGPSDAGSDSGSTDASVDSGSTDAGPGYCGAGVDAGTGGGGSAQPLPPGFNTGQCDGPEWFSLRGPALWTTTFGGSTADKVWPLELDPGQTLDVQFTTFPGGFVNVYLGFGPCKQPSNQFATPHTATARENLYLHVHGLSSTVQVRISGASAAPFCPACDTTNAIDVALGTPFHFGDFNPGSPELTMPNALSAPGALSCTGTRHLGGDALWRVHLLAGQSVKALASNPSSQGGDPLAFYLVRDCGDLTNCRASAVATQMASINYVAPQDEVLYLVLDRFSSADYRATYVRIDVAAP